jgi:acetyl/propionyl-CoA carboxylase alpha subunit
MSARRRLRVTPVGGGPATTVEPGTAEDPATRPTRDTFTGQPTPTLGRRGTSRVEVVVRGWRFLLDVEDDERAALRERATRERVAATHGGAFEVRAIIPGRVVSVAVAAGDAVVAGQPLLVVEAMKMQNELRAPRDGTVARVAVGAGETVELGDVLAVLE